MRRAARRTGSALGTPYRGRHLIGLAMVVLGLVGTLVAAWWSLAGTDRASGAPQRDGWVAVGNGWVLVERVVDRSVDHAAMPNMQTMPDADPVPDGQVRYLVQLRVAAEDSDFTWSADEITVSGTGIAPLPPHDLDLGDGTVPARSTVAGTVTLDVPEDAVGLRLGFAEAVIPLSIEPADAPTPGHSDGHQDHHTLDPDRDDEPEAHDH